MKLRGLLIANSIVFGCSGVMAILFPSLVLSIYGVESGPAASLMAQYAGLGSLAIALIAFFARNVMDRNAQKALTMALMICNILGVLVSVSGTISGVMKIGWAVVGLYLLFATGYAYFLIFFNRGINDS